MKLNFSKKWKVRLLVSVITLALSALGYELTPQQQAAMKPVAQGLVESVTYDSETDKQENELAPPPYIEPEPIPPELMEVVADGVLSLL